MIADPLPAERLVLRPLRRADTLFDRVYGAALNPLYQSGTIVVALFLVVIVSGLWLLLFYRVGAPWQSVAQITLNGWSGNWVRGLHRYASDLAVLATAVHALRMFAQGRSRGPRTLAWVSGWILLAALMVCGWTGYVMVWDTFGQYLAREGARVIDALPLLSEPTSRAFTGEQPLPPAFFFLNLFAHVGIPLGMAMIFWLHVKRLARPRLLPPPAVMWTVIGALTAAAVLRPATLGPAADALVLPERVPVDLVFAAWIPVVRHLGGGTVLLLGTMFGAGLLVLPEVIAWRKAAPPPSSVDEQLCVGCNQCALDCPYEAIAMVERHDGRTTLVAHVDESRCVSCGICAGSCPPMGVGPPGRTGRDQLAQVREFLDTARPADGAVVAVVCQHAAGTFAARIAAAGASPYPVTCAGNMHTSVIEMLLRGGAGGVLVLACPPRDCWHREGAHWLVQRMYHEREAELQGRVDRARVRLVSVNSGEHTRALEALAVFAAEVRALEVARPETDIEVSGECAAAPAMEEA
jgi:coenzyme F420-reducing hydrogenase delta subunit/Pyruvate/2-oxoacid:ferredoxin oxidoreductase delta subunit